jgi:hypothetical protein
MRFPEAGNNFKKIKTTILTTITKIHFLFTEMKLNKLGHIQLSKSSLMQFGDPFATDFSAALKVMSIHFVILFCWNSIPLYIL